jgi:hypothetical protein
MKAVTQRADVALSTIEGHKEAQLIGSGGLRDGSTGYRIWGRSGEGGLQPRKPGNFIGVKSSLPKKDPQSGG